MTFLEITKALGVENHSDLPDGYYPVPDNRKGELCTKEMIDSLQEKYDLFGEYYRAVLEGFSDLKNDPLRKNYLDSISLYLKDASLNEAIAIKYPPSVNTPASNMLPLLAHLPSIEDTYEMLIKKGLTHNEAKEDLGIYKKYLREEEHYRSKIVGIQPFISTWISRFDKGAIVYFGHSGINFQPIKLPENFPFIIRNKQSGELKALFGNDYPVHKSGIPLGNPDATDEDGSFKAKFYETESDYVGHPASENFISKEIKAFSKDEWELIISPREDVITLHVFHNADLTPEAVDYALNYGVKRCIECYPEYNFSGVRLCTWFLNTNVCEILGEEAKISKFANRFLRFPGFSGARLLFGCVFPKGYDNLQELEERTTLQRGIKKLLLEGKHIYEPIGIIPIDNFKR